MGYQEGHGRATTSNGTPTPDRRLSLGKAVRLSHRSTPLTTEEVAAAIDVQKFPAILTVHQAAELLQISHHTLYRAVSQNRYKDAVRRGKPLRFWRDRLVIAFFGSPQS